MAMNREQKRMLQKQGEVDEQGEPVASRRDAPQQRETRVGPRQFMHEVRNELRKVAWPSRSEVINYSIIVIIVVISLTAILAGFDFIFGQGILELFER